jgi:amidase
MAELHELTAIEAAALMENGEISSEDLVRDCLARIEAREETVRAWQYLDPDFAVAEAQKADATPRRGPLHGIPFAAKDIIDTADMPTENGSPIHAGRRPAKDALCVTAMRNAGAVLMGKTVTTEFATFTPGKTRNPHNPGHTPGGSSSGSGAAVGDRMVPLAFGSQTAGSLIRPAAFCGAHGLKPTHGTVDLSGILPLEATLDTLGYMARSVDDLAAYYATVRGITPDPVPDGIGRAPRVGLCRTPFWSKAQPETVEAVEDAAARFAELGADVAEAELPATYADIIDSHRAILNRGLTVTLGHEYAEHPDQLSERLRAMIADGFEVSDESYAAAVAHAEACRTGLDDAFGEFDVFLAPSAPGEAPEGLDATGDPVFQIMWTTVGAPCVTIPYDTGPRGLPVGVQLIGRRGDDDTVLAIAKWFDARL